MRIKVDSYRLLVMPKDLNPEGYVFGGQMMLWIDEAAAMYAMCQCQSKFVRTLKVSDVRFHYPVPNGANLTFETHTVTVGTSSLTVRVEVVMRDFDLKTQVTVCTCDVIMVRVNPETGKSMPHGIQDEKASLSTEDYYNK